MKGEMRLGELATIESGFAFRSSDWIAEGNPVVKIKNVKDGFVSLDDCAFVPDEIAAKASRFLAREGDVLVSLTGYVGQVGRVSRGDAVLVNQRVGLVRPRDESEKSFVYHLLRSLRTEIEELGTGTAQANVAPRDIMNLPVRTIENSSRRTIGMVLDYFDSKIDLNNRTCLVIEEIAQALFKSWFLNFDPVKAKMAGQKPVGMDDATAALFPDSMEDSELGPIPKGWECKTADNIFSVGIGRTPPRKEPEWFCEGGDCVDWVSIRDMGSYGVFSSGTSEGLTEEAVKKFRVPIVPKGTVLMSFKLTVGKLCITDRDLVTNEAIAHFKQNESSPISSLFAYLWLSNHDMESLDSTSSIGTATNSGLVKAIRFLIPSADTISHFESLASPLFNQIESLTAQSRKLVELRDSLLPRLISGELRIPDEMLVS